MVSTKLKLPVLFQLIRQSRTVVHRCSIKNLSQKFSQTSEEHIVLGVLFYQIAVLDLATIKIEGPVLVFCCEFCEISHNNFM